MYQIHQKLYPRMLRPVQMYQILRPTQMYLPLYHLKALNQAL